jgi:hypothetical protein
MKTMIVLARQNPVVLLTRLPPRWFARFRPCLSPVVRMRYYMARLLRCCPLNGDQHPLVVVCTRAVVRTDGLRLLRGSRNAAHAPIWIGFWVTDFCWWINIAAHALHLVTISYGICLWVRPGRHCFFKLKCCAKSSYITLLPQAPALALYEG